MRKIFQVLQGTSDPDMDINKDDLPGPFMLIILLSFCVFIAFLDLGNKWYEIIIRIIAFLFALSFAFNLYAFVTEIVYYGKSKLKGLYHFLLLLIFPIIIYLGINIYLL